MVGYEDLLGKPNLKISGLQIWIHGREEDISDWLIVTMHCGGGNSDVWVKNSAVLILIMI